MTYFGPMTLPESIEAAAEDVVFNWPYLTQFEVDAWVSAIAQQHRVSLSVVQTAVDQELGLLCDEPATESQLMGITSL